MRTMNMRIVVLAVLALASARAQAGLLLTAEAAGIQSSQVAGVTTETFDGITTGNYATLSTVVGTFGPPGLSIDGADVFGGAGGIGHFMAVGVQSDTTSTTLALDTPQAYFGFWWSAADAGNVLEIFSGATLLATFNPAAALGALSAAYNGNPNGGGNAGEKYAYINIFGTAGTEFDRIVFTETTDGGFEVDNISILEAEVLSPGGTPIPGLVPEPASLALLALGLAGIGFSRRTRAS